MVEIGALFNADNPAARLPENSTSAFRDADFLKIMLSELANQDPMEPMETSKLVENMQKVQDLANTRFERFRNDLSFAQEVMGKGITVTESNISEDEAQTLKDRGLNPAVGFDVVTGQVSSFRVVGEQVWVNIEDKDYKLENLQRIEPETDGIDGKIGLANDLLGFFVSYSADTQGDNGAGLVSDIQWDQSGEVFLSVGGKFVPYENITSIGLPNSPNP